MCNAQITPDYPAQYAQKFNSFRDRYMPFYLDPDSYRIAPFRIFGNLYYVGDEKVCMHLVDTGSGLILFDCGYGHTTHMIEDSIRALGFAMEDLKWIVITHGHFDHFGSGNILRERYGCKILMSRADWELILERPDRALCQLGPDPNMSICEPDDVIDDADTLTLGNTTVHFRLAPGHTMGTLSYFFDAVDGIETRRAGCWGGIGFFTVYKAHSRAFGLPENKGALFLRSARMLKDEHVDIHLGNHPGDNCILQKRQRMLENPQKNPFVDSRAWPDFLDRLEQQAVIFCKEDT